MAYYYRKNVNDTVNDIKLKTQIGILTLKLSESNDKIDYLLEVDKNIKKDVGDNLNLINSNKESISSNSKKIDDIKENNLKISNNVFNDEYHI